MMTLLTRWIFKVPTSSRLQRPELWLLILPLVVRRVGAEPVKAQARARVRVRRRLFSDPTGWPG